MDLPPGRQISQGRWVQTGIAPMSPVGGGGPCTTGYGGIQLGSGGLFVVEGMIRKFLSHFLEKGVYKFILSVLYCSSSGALLILVLNV